MSVIILIESFKSNFKMEDPFIFCAHHNDFYPAGNAALGLNMDGSDRNIGNDFSNKDHFSMYHGREVPGFPMHPHRGFETVSIVLKGYVDHFDSKGSHGRYGNGDVQWLTTGSGCQHAEMFPLLNEDQPNPLELLQIWLNLPRKSKFVKPYYKMLWKEEIPIVDDTEGLKATVITGDYQGIQGLPPNPDSYANDPNHKVRIVIFKLAPNASLSLEATLSEVNRNLYFYEGDHEITIEDEKITRGHRIKLAADEGVTIKNGASESQLLLLEGRPIGEPLVQYGPFVMTSREEIINAFRDYEATEFGGWPWDRPDPVHKREQKRFSVDENGKKEEK